MQKCAKGNSVWAHLRALEQDLQPPLLRQRCPSPRKVARVPVYPQVTFGILHGILDSHLAAYAKVERITPEGQTPAQRGEELSPFALLSGLPFDNHIHQAFTTQSDITLAKAT